MSFIITPHLILQKNDRILLLRRHVGSHVFGGYWHLPTGVVGANETPISALKRKVQEELGILVTATLQAVIVSEVPDYRNPTETYRDLCFFFLAENYQGAIENKEPQFHSDLKWFDVHSLPDLVVPVVQFGLRCVAQKITYDHFEWTLSV
jgi:8-oxo-dGTP diphosphatase